MRNYFIGLFRLVAHFGPIATIGRRLRGVVPPVGTLACTTVTLNALISGTLGSFGIRLRVPSSTWRYSLLTFDRLTVRYGAGIRAAESVSFEVRSGTICAIIGGNGAGKTTLMRAASGTLSYHGGRVVSGEITLSGQRIEKMRPHLIVKNGLALVPEGRHVFSDLSIEENLLAGAATVRSRTLRASRMKNAYEMFEVLGRRRTQPASLLSGGEQQMLAIARGLMSGPEVLLLDEPSLGLAPKVVAHIGRTLQDVNAIGTTVVLVEQNAALALGIADQGIVIERGSVSMQGPAAEMRTSEEIKRMYLGGSTDETDDEMADLPHASLERWVP